MGPSRRREHAKRPRLCSRESFDDRGNRMSPSWARKGSKRWRYYVSQAALQGDKTKAGSITRVPAGALEELVAEAAGKVTSDHRTSRADVRDLIDRVKIGCTEIQVQLSEAAEAETDVKTLTLPWTLPSPHRKRNGALREAHRWLDELVSDPLQTSQSLALREGKTDRSIRMTLSLAFLAPDIVKAAVEGRLPRGYGLKRLVDLPMAWPNQWLAVGLKSPARA
jgi:site-specific DNA recombinase